MLYAILVAGDFVESQPDVIRMGEQVPLAEGAETRAQLVGEFGQATVYVFDLYSIALSKLARAAGKDVQDVKDMLSVGVITCRELRRHYESVAARFSKYVNRGDQAAFRRKVEGFLAEHCP